MLHTSKVNICTYSGASHNGPSHQRTTSIQRTLAMSRIKITIVLVYKKPPTSGRFLILDNGQSAWFWLKSIENGLSRRTNRKPHPSVIMSCITILHIIRMHTIIINQCAYTTKAPSARAQYSTVYMRGTVLRDLDRRLHALALVLCLLNNARSPSASVEFFPMPPGV